MGKKLAISSNIQVRDIKLPDAGQVEHWDKSTPGLCIRAGRTAKSFVFFYRYDGHQRRETLGRYNENAPALNGALPEWGKGRPLTLKTAHDSPIGCLPSTLRTSALPIIFPAIQRSASLGSRWHATIRERDS